MDTINRTLNDIKIMQYYGNMQVLDERDTTCQGVYVHGDVIEFVYTFDECDDYCYPSWDMGHSEAYSSAEITSWCGYFKATFNRGLYYTCASLKCIYDGVTYRPSCIYAIYCSGRQQGKYVFTLTEFNEELTMICKSEEQYDSLTSAYYAMHQEYRKWIDKKRGNDEISITENC